MMIDDYNKRDNPVPYSINNNKRSNIVNKVLATTTTNTAIPYGTVQQQSNRNRIEPIIK